MKFFLLSGNFYKQNGSRLIKTPSTAWDESKHPRDKSGKFGAGGNTTAEQEDYKTGLEAKLTPQQKGYVDRARSAASAGDYKQWRGIIDESRKTLDLRGHAQVEFLAQYEGELSEDLKDYVDRAKTAAKAENFKQWESVIGEVRKSFGGEVSGDVVKVAPYEADTDEEEEDEEELVHQVQNAVEDLDDDQLRKVMELIKGFKK